MRKKESKTDRSLSTPEKIKAVARKLFHHRGFSATRTRDIAKESGINLALLNYYFGSKQKLFHQIMIETMQEFFVSIKDVVNVHGTTVEEKTQLMTSKYIELLSRQPELPLFMLSEMRNGPEKMIGTVGLKGIVTDSYLFQQITEKKMKYNGELVNPVHYVANLLAMAVFPFVAFPVLRSILTLTDDDFGSLMNERKKLIPMWMGQMLNDNDDRAS